MARSPEFETLKSCLEGVPDPRGARGRRHVLADVLFLALVAMVAGADNAEAIEEYGEANEDWFREFLELPHGIPSQDTYLRVFAALDPDAFGAAFRQWVGELRQTWGEGHVAIDGKTVRRSFDTASGHGPIHVVSAWLVDDGLVLGQCKVGDKANEIVAIPELLRLLDVRRATVTIDAMGCQRSIAQQLVDSEANYVLAVKDNQPTLRANIVSFFADAERTERPLDDPAPIVETVKDVDAGHGRVEERTCWLSPDLSWIDNADDWAGLAGVAKVERVRYVVSTDKSSRETAYYILSDATTTAAELNRTVRDHWGIENSLHWVLDMSFDEDRSRIRSHNAAQNFAVVRHVALNLLRTAPGKKKSVALRRMRCAWDRSYLISVLSGAGAA